MGSQASRFLRENHDSSLNTTVELPSTPSELRTWWENVRDNVSALPLGDLYQVLKSTAALAPVSQLKDAIELAERLVTLINTVPRQKEQTSQLTAKITEVLLDISWQVEANSAPDTSDSVLVIKNEISKILNEEAKWISTHAGGMKWFIQSGDFAKMLKSHAERIDVLIQRSQTRTLRKLDGIQDILLAKSKDHERLLNRLLQNSNRIIDIVTAETQDVKEILAAVNEIRAERVQYEVEPLSMARESWICTNVVGPFEGERRWSTYIADEIVEDKKVAKVIVHMISPSLMATEAGRKKAIDRFHRCQYIWSQVSDKRHPYILPLQGAYEKTTKFPYPHFKHEYREYTADTIFSESTSAIYNDRVKYIYQLALAIQCLHQGINGGMKIIHARVMPRYIYIDAHTALLSNINMASLVSADDVYHPSSATTIDDEGKLYLAPEALGLGPGPQPPLDSTKGDVYSWALTSIRILTGQNPFTQGNTNIRNFLSRLLKDSYRPPQLQEFGPIKLMGLAHSTAPEVEAWETDERLADLWKLFESCWAFEREDRCSIDDVVLRLEAFRPDLTKCKPS